MIQRQFIIACATCYSVFGLSLVTSAQPPAGGPGTGEPAQRPALDKLLAEADANGDGKLDFAEVHAKMPRFPEERFKALDKNGNGSLEKDEIPRRGGHVPGPVLDHLRAADTNQDRRVSRAEFEAQFPQAPAERFAMLDRNGDGFLDRQDRPELPGQEIRGEAAADNDNSGARAYLAKLMRDDDTNQDGQLTLAEVLAAKPGFPESVYHSLDRNRDGMLSEADIAHGSPEGQPEPGKRGKQPKPGHKPEDGQKGKEMGKAKAGQSMDLNHDGKITFEEATQANPEYTRERFDAHDRNGDGVLTKEDRKEKS